MGLLRQKQPNKKICVRSNGRGCNYERPLRIVTAINVPSTHPQTFAAFYTDEF
jgi:hypothetical protein